MARASDKYASPYGKGGAMPQAVNLQRAAMYVQQRQPFASAQCFGRWVCQILPLPERSVHDDIVHEFTDRKNYVVYTGFETYAQPLFVYDGDAQVWFENSEGSGREISRQRKRLRPQANITVYDGLTTEAIARFGFRYVAKLRMNRSPRRDWRAELRSMISSYGVQDTHTWLTYTDRLQRRDTAEQLVRQWRERHVLNMTPEMIEELKLLANGGKDENGNPE